MRVKLHRCRWEGLKRGHACWRVERALQEVGVDYEIVVEPTYPRGRRKDVIAATGQSRLPCIELPSGEWWREDSAAMAEAIRAGRLSQPS